MLKILPVKNIFKNYWAIFFIVIVWFIFAKPYFLNGLVPYASTYQVNFFKPWSAYEKFWGPVKNNAMPDVHTQIYPWKKLTIDTFRKGQLPLWNPYNFSGNPHLANYQSAVLSPLNLLFFIFPFIDAWSILILLQPFLAGIFMYLFMREIGVSKVGSLVSSITFMFCGFIVVWMAYGTLSMAIAFLPLSLFAIEKYSNTKKFRYLFLLALTIPLSLFSGHFQMSIYFLLGVLLYAFYKGLVTKHFHSTFYILSSVALGLILSLPQLLPSIELYFQSVRSEIFNRGGGIPWYYLITSYAPDFFGNPVTRNDWFGFYAEWSSFIGIIPLCLAIIAIISKDKKKHALFFLITGVISLALAVDSPIQKIIGILKIPVLSTSNPTRIIVLSSFSVSVLAGFGLDSLKILIEKRFIKKIVVLFTGIGLMFLSIWVLLLVFKIMPSEKIVQAERNFILPTILFFVFIGGTFVALYRRKFFFLITYLFLFAVIFDSLRFVQKWMPFDPRSLVYPNVSVINAIKQYAGNGRVFGNIGTEVSSYYGIETIEGYDPLYIDRYGEFIRSADNGEFLIGERSVVKLARNGKYTNRVLDLLGVNLIFHPVADTNQGWAYPVWKNEKRFTLVYKDDKFQLFRNNNAIPRVSLFYNTEIINDKKEIIKRFYQDDFNFRKILIIEESPGIVQKLGTGSARIISYTPNQIKIEVTTSVPALLFLSDNYYPGWKAIVNGAETKIYRADYTFRAVPIPAGKSKVEFNYDPSTLLRVILSVIEV